MNHFDTLVDELDNVHSDTFAVDVIINGEPTKGIFDEYTGEFEDVMGVLRTLEISMSDLPSTSIVNDESTVYMVDDGRTFDVYRQERIGNQIILELR